MRSHPHGTNRYWLAIAALTCASIFGAHATELASATIEEPRAVTAKGGSCRILGNGTFSGMWGPNSLPVLALTIGPGPMTEPMHSSTTKFAGPGKYVNEIVAVYLGKTALEDSYGGLGTVVLNPDGRTGTFTLNNGSASGRFDCGGPPIR